MSEIEQGILEKERASIVDLKTKAFLRQEYPLSEEGIELKGRIDGALVSGNRKELELLSNQLPTVENPSLYLFKDLEITLDQEKRIFGIELSTIQTTKGCSHKCEFCAADAPDKIQRMPFVAVLKIAEKKRQKEKEADKAWQSWGKVVKATTGFDPDGIGKKYDQRKDRGMGIDMFLFLNYHGLTSDAVLMELKRKYWKHPVKSYSRYAYPEALVYKPYMIHRAVMNYHDSDPFDYKDPTFLHENGAPADYGDVFAALASESGPIHITTAGWSKRNHLAQRAMQRIIDICKINSNLIDNPRVSISKYEYRSRQNPFQYLDDMKTVIKMFAAVSLPSHERGNQREVLIYTDEDILEDPGYISVVVDPLKKYIQGNQIPVQIKENKVSYYSGRMARKESKDDHHDIMACGAGYFIIPDGSVLFLKAKEYVWGEGIVEKGVRPEPIGLQLYKRTNSN